MYCSQISGSIYTEYNSCFHFNVIIINLQYNILQIHHHQCHLQCVFPQTMRTQTEMELRMYKQDASGYHSMRELAFNNAMGAGKVQEQIKGMLKSK